MEAASFKFNQRTTWRYRTLAAGTLLAIVVVGFAVTTFIGTMKAYSPVPHSDMWDGYILPYVQFQISHDLSLLFGQANEHRIPLSRLLFWIDLEFFRGRSAFLIAVHLVLLASVWLTFALIARRILAGHGNLWIAVSLVLGPLCFSWFHKDNITWGYQSQFFFSFLIPLVTFQVLAYSAEAKHPALAFALALGLGVLSLGSMSNGLLVFPLMVGLLVALRRRFWPWIAITVATGTLATTAWFNGYVFLPHADAPLLSYIHFVFAYLGEPFRTPYAGAFFALMSIVLVLRWLVRWRTEPPAVAALIAFLMFVVASACATALGRATAEFNGMVTDRYATPALYGWCALLLLCFHNLRRDRNGLAMGFIAAGLVIVILLPQQAAALSDKGAAMAHSRDLAGLALRVDVADHSARGAVFPTDQQEGRERLAYDRKFAVEYKVSIFADGPFTEAVGRLGQSAAPDLRPCEGAVEDLRPAGDDPHYLRVSGWSFDKASRRQPAFIFLTRNGVVEGVAVTGAPRADVARMIAKEAHYAGFSGYVRSGDFTVKDLAILCSLGEPSASRWPGGPGPG
ncbi:MAG: hypothetical protein AB7E79_07065 [Rhodospirillaceae bacterium]